MVGEEDSTCSRWLNFTIFVITFIRELSERRTRCLQLFPRIMWSTDQNWFQTWLQQKLSKHKQKPFASPSKNAEEKKKDTKKKKKKKKKNASKLSALQASTVIQILTNRDIMNKKRATKYDQKLRINLTKMKSKCHSPISCNQTW